MPYYTSYPPASYTSELRPSTLTPTSLRTTTLPTIYSTLLLTATFSSINVSFDAPTPAGPRTILYGTKRPSDNVWNLSLPTHEHRAMTIVRSETHAKIAMYAAASFGHPSSRTFHRTVQLGYLSNYPISPRPCFGSIVLTLQPPV